MAGKLLFAFLIAAAFVMNVSVPGLAAPPACSQLDADFIAWSNDMPEEEAKAQLKECLSTFETVDEAVRWLSAKGFSVESPRPMNVHEARAIGINQAPAFSLVAGWDVKRRGAIFAHGLLAKAESWAFVYGVSVEILYTGDFAIDRLTITKTRL